MRIVQKTTALLATTLMFLGSVLTVAGGAESYSIELPYLIIGGPTERVVYDGPIAGAGETCTVTFQASNDVSPHNTDLRVDGVTLFDVERESGAVTTGNGTLVHDGTIVVTRIVHDRYSSLEGTLELHCEPPTTTTTTPPTTTSEPPSTTSSTTTTSTSVPPPSSTTTVPSTTTTVTTVPPSTTSTTTSTTPPTTTTSTEPPTTTTPSSSTVPPTTNTSEPPDPLPEPPTMFCEYDNRDADTGAHEPIITVWHPDTIPGYYPDISVFIAVETLDGDTLGVIEPAGLTTPGRHDSWLSDGSDVPAAGFVAMLFVNETLIGDPVTCAPNVTPPVVVDPPPEGPPELPYTGAPLWVFAVAGVLFLLVGGGLLARKRSLNNGVFRP